MKKILVRLKMTKNKIYISWEEFEKMSRDLAKEIQQSPDKFEGIYGIPRGGMPLAVYLSHYLGLPLIESVENTVLPLPPIIL